MRKIPERPSINKNDFFSFERLGVIAIPDLRDPHETWGILNPGACRNRDGQLYIFPRIVAEGNYSRIAVARVIFDEDETPVSIERLGYAIEPTEDYEKNPKSGGGCEDARVTFIKPLDLFVMTYTAYTVLGPRIAIAISQDLFSWEKLGLLTFAPECPVNFNSYGNKDGLFFPDIIHDEYDQPGFTLIHRPTYHVAQADGTVSIIIPPGVVERRQSLWMSHLNVDSVLKDPSNLTIVNDTHLFAMPEQPWESVKIGGGTPPILTKLGWFFLYHAVSGNFVEGVALQTRLMYQCGAMILDAQSPGSILFRTPHPIFSPKLPEEKEGVVPNVVFPTGIDHHILPSKEEVFDIYYGMADYCIGAARLRLPQTLPD